MFLKDFIVDLFEKLQTSNPKLYTAVITILIVAVVVIEFLPQLSGVEIPAAVAQVVSFIQMVLVALGFSLGYARASAPGTLTVTEVEGEALPPAPPPGIPSQPRQAPPIK